MMFKCLKTRRTSGEPTTPKMALAPLPDSDSCKGSPMLTRPSAPLEKPAKSSFFGRLTPDRRSATPIPVAPSRRSKETYVSRLRTVSMSNHDDDVALLKPHKASPQQHPPVQPVTRNTSMTGGKPGILKTNPKYVDAVIPSLPTQGGRGQVEHPGVCATMRPLKSAMKGGAIQMISNTVAKHEFPVTPIERRHSRRKHEPTCEDKYVGKQQPRSRNHSLTDIRPEYPLNQSPKYVQAYIKEQPLKEVVLGWPLIDFSNRRNMGMPPVYFDVGFDPKEDKWAVRAHRGGYSSPLTKEENEVLALASPHDIITDMVIECDRLARWPIHVRRSRGLRCIDIFQAIFDTYNVLLTSSEKQMIGEEYLRRCHPAFKQRCADSPGLPLYNERCGMRRVDLLRGRRIFKGLSPVQGSQMHWKLHFDDTH